MNKHVPIRSDAFTYRTEDCPDCWEGRYEVPEGPGYVSYRCDTCDGSGEVEAVCDLCGKHEPLNDEGECEKCHDGHELSIAEFNAKYPVSLTECRGDPLLKRRAA